MECGFDSLFIETLSERLICPVCRKALKEPKLTDCGHHFCTGCLSASSQGRASFLCPVCRTGLVTSKIYPNNALKREILNLQIKCGRQDKGCEWAGELRTERNHDENCQYVSKYCTNSCGESVMRKDMDDHVNKQCSRRSVYCEHCSSEVKFDELQDHYKVCPMYPVECPYDCGEILARHQMDSHVDRQGSCPNTPFDCDFKNSGCQFQGKRSDLLKHTEDNVVNHLSLVATKLTVQLEKSDLELEATKDKLAATEKRLKELESIKDELVDTEKRLDVTKYILADTEKRLTEVEDKLADVELQHYEELNRRGLQLPPDQPKKFIYLWRIEKWSQKVLAAKCNTNPVKSIRSDPFYVYPG